MPLSSTGATRATQRGRAMDDRFQADLFAAPGVVEDTAPATTFKGVGARDRASVLRRRMIEHGPRTLGESETLELLLALCGSYGRDPGRLAETLLVRFGALPRVFGATLPELALTVGEPPAAELKVLHDLTLRVLEFPIRRRCVLSSWSAVSAYLKVSLAGRSREAFRVLFLDRANQLIADELMRGHGRPCAGLFARDHAARA